MRQDCDFVVLGDPILEIVPMAYCIGLARAE